MSDDPDERAQERVGSVLNDKWTLEKLVGIGGMAAVYAGVHRNGARAAVKVLHPSLARRPELRERFLREGYAANRVNHAGVVKVLDDDVIESGPDEGGAFLVMELLEGESVEDRMERGPPIDEKEMLAIAASVLDVLAAAHQAGVIHRDLKPENLFLARDPEKPDAPPKIKILDFGLARVLEAQSKTMAGMAIGTPSYMPPEQAAGRIHEIDARSDLFALGATCFRILAGRTVHPADGALAICARMAKEPAPKLRTLAPHVSPKGAGVIDRALEFHREARFPNAVAMRRAVDAAIEALGGEAIPVDSTMIEVVSDERAEKEKENPPRSRAWLYALVLFLAALGVAAKLVYDKLQISSTVPVPASVSVSVSVSVPVSVSVSASASVPDVIDASDDAEALEASTEDAAEDATLDGEISDAHATSTLADAGRQHHRDGGAMHHTHHGHHRPGRR